MAPNRRNKYEKVISSSYLFLYRSYQCWCVLMIYQWFSHRSVEYSEKKKKIKQDFVYQITREYFKVKHTYYI